jgi:SNF family Na+-dependent transporter
MFDLIFCCQGGLHYFEFFDHYAIGAALIVIVFIQLIAISKRNIDKHLVWVFKVENLVNMAKEYSNEVIPYAFVFITKFVDPVIMFILIIISFVSEVSKYAKYSSKILKTTQDIFNSSDG